MADDQQVGMEPFNSAVENGLRSLVILVEAYPEPLDLERLMQFDWLLVHSGDAGGPESLHPPTPLRSGELLVRRQLIQRGLWLCMSRGLIERLADPAGIHYRALDEAGAFLACLRSPYATDLKERARWVCGTFLHVTPTDLDDLFHQTFDRWIAEFQAIERSSESEP